MPGPLKRLSEAVDRVNDWIGATIRWLTVVMILVGATGALVRYSSRYLGLSLNLTPVLEIQWYLFSVIFLLGAAYGMRHDVHVRVDVLYSRVGPKGRAWIDLVGNIVFLVPFCALMLLVSWPAVLASWSTLEMSPDPGGLPRYPIKTLILVSFALLLLQALSQILEQVAVLRGEAAEAPRTHEQELHV